MIVIDAYEEFCNSTEELPAHAKSKISKFFLDRFTGNVGDLFCEMKVDLPLVYEALKGNYGEPVIGIKTIAGRKKYDLIMENSEWTLVGDLYSRDFYDLYSFSEEYYMLSDCIQSYYKVTQGMQLVSNGNVASFQWNDLPLSLIGRRKIIEITGLFGCDESYIKKIPGYEELVAWMIGGDGDLILVNEKNRKMYSAQVKQLADFCELDQPDRYWDQHCANVLMRGPICNSKFISDNK